MTFLHAAGGVREEGKPRNENDHYPTPPFATYALCKLASPPKKLWEPAAGRGWMARELRRNGHDVFASDLFSYDDPVSCVKPDVDFLKTVDPTARGVVTNPPYGNGLAQAFVEHACENYGYVAMLCRIMFTEGKGRHELFTKKHVPSRIMTFSGRFSCNEEYLLSKPRGMIQYAWFVWDTEGIGIAQHGDTRFSWIDTDGMWADWSRSMSQEQHLEMRGHLD